MKHLHLLFILATASFVLLIACNKDDDKQKQPDPVSFTNGEGIIGREGGIISVEDVSSPLNGISIKIPAGALSSKTNIRIELAPDSIKLPTDPSAMVIKFEPEGLKFSVPIEISFPLQNGTDTTRLYGYYINSKEEIIKQFPREIENNKIIILTDHFSYYTVSAKGIVLNKKMYYYDGPFGKRMTANIWIEGPIENTNEWGLAGVPARNSNVLEVVGNYESTILIRSEFEVTLKRYVSLWFDSTVGTCKVNVKNQDLFSTGQIIRVVPIDYNLPHNANENIQIQSIEQREGYFGGKYICFHWDEVFNESRNYYLTVNFRLIDQLNRPYSMQFSFNTKGGKLKPSEMIQHNPDVDVNFVLDNIKDQNNPPTVSTSEVLNITHNSATAGGNVTNQGSSPVTAHGLVWNTQETPTLESKLGEKLIGTGTGPFSGEITNLTPNTTYYVRAYATNSVGTAYGNQISFTTKASTDSAPTAAFTASPTSGTVPLAVNFTDQSTNNPTSWLWEFGDGTTSTQANPSKTYNAAGTYTVKLTATNSHGSNTHTKNNYITVSGNPPTAAFTASPTFGAVPLAVNFTDQSTNNPTSWLWEFGDGTTSTQRNPSKTYNAAGTYTVKLTATNSHGSNTHTKNNYIEVSPAGDAPTAAFTANPTSGTVPLAVNFTDQSTNNPTSWLWEFGDGTTSTQRNPSKTYNAAGTYTVKLTATNSHGSNTHTKNNYITVTTVSSWPRDTITMVVDVLNPATGKTWMDRNLGASRAATSSTDAQAYGDLYQWGRSADGHQKRNSGTTTTLSTSDTPGHGDFIIAPNDPWDWRSPQNNNLWQGQSGKNNPCPIGYRLPTSIEWNDERLSWGSNNNADGAFASPLKLSLAGVRSYTNGLLVDFDKVGGYWSSTSAGNRYLIFAATIADVSYSLRALGQSVRCIKD